MPYFINNAAGDEEPTKGGSMQNAGGVGGLLKEGDWYPTYDANGNIMQKLDGAGAMVMNVDYDPFGRTLGHSGSISPVGEYGFSTKPYVTELHCYYYGYRFYDPLSGRWQSRDPIGEEGGLNLYGFVANDAVNAYDFLGLATSRITVTLSGPGSLPFTTCSAQFDFQCDDQTGALSGGGKATQRGFCGGLISVNINLRINSNTTSSSSCTDSDGCPGTEPTGTIDYTGEIENCLVSKKFGGCWLAGTLSGTVTCKGKCTKTP